eukprot:4837599-Amphidinium_carterae.1
MWELASLRSENRSLVLTYNKGDMQDTSKETTASKICAWVMHVPPKMMIFATTFLQTDHRLDGFFESMNKCVTREVKSGASAGSHTQYCCVLSTTTRADECSRSEGIRKGGVGDPRMLSPPQLPRPAPVQREMITLAT